LAIFNAAIFSTGANGNRCSTCLSRFGFDGARSILLSYNEGKCGSSLAEKGDVVLMIDD
jgi:hypothetical protein